MRIINTFNDLDLLERLYPVCNYCEHIGKPLNEKKIKELYGIEISVVYLMHKLRCTKCGSKDIYLRIVSNEEMPHLGGQAVFSEDLMMV